MTQPNQDRHQKFLDGVRIFNKYIFNRITLRFAGTGKAPFSILRHIGRKSGSIYQTPVLATYIGDTVIIPLSYGEKVDWLQNVLAGGGCEIRWCNTWLQAINPVVIDSETALSLLPEKRQKMFARFKLKKFVRLQIKGYGSNELQRNNARN
jgi:deazaflavin-dependent oxidoreductase (nitroreductase family)